MVKNTLLDMPSGILLSHKAYKLCGIEIKHQNLDNSIKNQATMKFFAAVLATVAIAQNDGDRKVPPPHPIQRLNRMVAFSTELMNDWYEFLPSRQNWIEKFTINGERMRYSFERGNQ